VIEDGQQTGNVRPVLTIAVPTYNRERFLRELLDILFDQIIAEPRVELIISDNASPDETASLVQEFQKRGLSIRYMRNETNLGADRNLLQCYEQAMGKYVWIFGDDDIILPGGVAVLLSYIESRDYDIVYLNSHFFKGVYVPHILEAHRNATEITDIEQFARRINIFFTFISGNIVNKHRIPASNSAQFSEIVGTSLPQLAWIYSALNGYQRGLFIEERLIAARTNNTGAYKLLETFGPNLKRVTDQWLNNKRVGRLIINGALQRFWPWVLLQHKKASASFINEAPPADVLTPIFRDNMRYWIFAYPIMLLPYPLAAGWLIAIRILNRIDIALGSFMLG